MTGANFDLRLPWDSLGRWRRPVLIAVSVLAHGLVLGGLALRTFEIDRWEDDSAPPLYLEIEPRALLPDEKPRPRPAVSASAPRLIEVAPDTTGRASVSIHDPRLDDEDEDETTPNPRLSQAPPGEGLPGAEDPWRYRPESMAGAVGRSLRGSPIGCDMRDGRMSAAEQQLCDDRFNERAGRARPISGTDNPERDARFAAEGARALAQYEGRRRPLSGGTGVVGPADCPGSNFGTGCAGSHIDPSLAPESTQNIRTRRDGPRASGQPLTPGAGSGRDRE